MSSVDHIVAHGLTVRFSTDDRVLEDFDLSVPHRQFLTLVGPSGCGKSTLLRCLAGLQPATRGSVEFGAVGDGSPKVAYVFQDANLLPWRTVAENIRLPIELGPHPNPTTESTDRVADAMQRVGLDSRDADKRPNMLSGGMRMRVSLARAMITSPDILLLDEPFAAIDDISRQRLNEELLRLWHESAWTVVMVTHNVSEAVFLSQRILVLSHAPARIVDDIAVDLPSRAGEVVRTSTEYFAHVERVATSLRRAAELPPGMGGTA